MVRFEPSLASYIQEPEMANRARTRPLRGSDELDTEFTRGLGLYDSTMVVVGSMIGSGIFIVSADMARTDRQRRLAARRLGADRDAHGRSARCRTASWRR